MKGQLSLCDEAGGGCQSKMKFGPTTVSNRADNSACALASAAQTDRVKLTE